MQLIRSEDKPIHLSVHGALPHAPAAVHDQVLSSHEAQSEHWNWIAVRYFPDAAHAAHAIRRVRRPTKAEPGY